MTTSRLHCTGSFPARPATVTSIPAHLMTSTGITVSISSAPLARMTKALFQAIFMLYLLKTQSKQDFQETFTAAVEDLSLASLPTDGQPRPVLSALVHR